MIEYIWKNSDFSALNFLEVARNTIDIVYKDQMDSAPIWMQKLNLYLKITDLSGAWILLFLIMHLIVVDRCLIVALATRYRTKVTKRRAHVSIFIAAFVSVVITITTIVLEEFPAVFKTQHVFGELDMFFFKYVRPLFHVSFLILSTSAFSYIFYKLRTSIQRVATARFQSESSSAPTVSLSSGWLKKSMFSVSLLLVATYVLLLVLPDFAYLTYALIPNQPRDNIVEHICWLLWTLCNLTDAFIYLVANNKVKGEAMRLLHRTTTAEQSFRLSESNSVDADDVRQKYRP